MGILAALRTAGLIHRARRTSRRPYQRLQQLQEQGLRRLPHHAHSTIPLSRRLHQEAGFDPRSFRSLDDLGQAPLLSKERPRAAAPEDLVTAGTDVDRCVTVATSGSTGVPMRIFLGPRDTQWQFASAWHILFEHGFRWTDRTREICMTFGPSLAWQRLGVAPKDWQPVADPPEDWPEGLARRKYNFVVTDSSVLHALSELVEALGVPIKPPRVVVSDSETLRPGTRQIVQLAQQRLQLRLVAPNRQERIRHCGSLSGSAWPSYDSSGAGPSGPLVQCAQ